MIEKLIQILGGVATFYIIGSMIGSLMSLGTIYAGICALERWLDGTGTFSEVTYPFVVLGVILLIVLVAFLIGLMNLFFRR